MRTLSVGPTIARWSTALTAPVRRARRMAALCEWVQAMPGPPRLVRRPLLGRGLAEIAGDVRAAETPASQPPSPRPLVPSVKGTVAARTSCPPEAAAPKVRIAPTPPQPRPRRRSARADRALLCRYFDEPGQAQPPRRTPPLSSPVTRRPRPKPCPPAAAIAPASERAARQVQSTGTATERFQSTRTVRVQSTGTRKERVRISGTHAERVQNSRTHKGIEPPARQPIAGQVAPSDLLHRHAALHRRAEPAGTRQAAGYEPFEPCPHRRSRALPTIGERTAAPWTKLPPTKSQRPHGASADDTPTPGATPTAPESPTASERLGPAPIVTASHPALVEPQPVGAPAMPAATASLRKGAERDAAPDFLDRDALTERIARVLQDEARRHGIEV
jgi:hypothetical protein